MMAAEKQLHIFWVLEHNRVSVNEKAYEIAKSVICLATTLVKQIRKSLKTIHNPKTVVTSIIGIFKLPIGILWF